MALRASATSMKKRILAPLFLAGATSIGSAAVITVQSGGSIDPAGGEERDYDATGSAVYSTFAALGDKIIQANWSGVSGTSGNTINGEDVDVRIDHTVGGFSASPSAGGTSSFNTADVGTGYQWTGSNDNLLTISFGTASGPGNTTFTNDRTVQAAGLMLLNFGAAYTDVTIKYFNSANSVLSTQSFAGGGDLQNGSGGDFFTGYISGSQNIAYLTIDITRNAGTSSIALDAVTYVVPEPGSAVLLGLGTLGLLSRRRRSAKLEPTVPA